MRKIPLVKTLVVKIGSNIIADNTSGLNTERIERIASVLANIHKFVPEIIIVSSGAIAAGFKQLGFKSRPKEVADKQASAAVGQARLMHVYEDAFTSHNMHTAQILLTKSDFANRTRYLNARATIKRLLKLGAVPIINENDTVVVNELKFVESFGDNDNLSALVAGLVGADLLLVLSDVNGLYTADPSKDKEARLISELDEINDSIFKLAGSSSSGLGKGGMLSKVQAAQKATLSGCAVAILNGREPENIEKFIAGDNVGTYFKASPQVKSSKKQWLSYSAVPVGKITVDDGAKQALLIKHSSLLPTGVVAVEGEFKKGDIVAVMDGTGFEIAQGTVRYSSTELEKIKGLKLADATKLLERKTSSVVMHCDELGFS